MLYFIFAIIFYWTVVLRIYTFFPFSIEFKNRCILLIFKMLFHGFLGVDGLSIEISTMVDIRDQSNKELSMRLSTDIKSNDVFYTDLNGFQVRTPTDSSRRIPS